MHRIGTRCLFRSGDGYSTKMTDVPHEPAPIIPEPDPTHTPTIPDPEPDPARVVPEPSPDPEPAIPEPGTEPFNASAR